MTQLQPYQQRMLHKQMTHEQMAAYKRLMAIERVIRPALFRLGLIGQGGRLGFKAWLLSGWRTIGVRRGIPVVVGHSMGTAVAQLRGMQGSVVIDELAEGVAP